MNTWQILHVPDKPPIPPHQQPTVNVLASVIEPKLANTIIRRLNQISPLEILRHVKRIQKKHVEGGKIKLLVILCVAGNGENESNSIPEGVQQLINSYQLSPFITKVCQYAATSKEDWEEQCKLWPTSFHPPTYNVDGIGRFSEEDSHSVFDFMQLTLKMARSGDGLIVNAAVIVDPSVNQIIASACDQTCSLYSSKPESCIRNCTKQPEVYSAHPDSSVVADHVNLSSNGSHDELKQRHIGASCLNPWHWAQQKLHTSSSSWHPLRHASIVAIESSAARDGHLFPGFGHDGVDSIQCSSTSIPTKRQKTNSTNAVSGDKLNAHTEGLPSISARPYLCTGYDIYLVWEPCAMCAMALVHQRIRRIFYAFPNPHAGALGSVHRLQEEKRLNHHYAVFRVVLPKELLDRDEVARTSENDKSAITGCQ
ncbi:hypothetical protein Ddye_005338 [Dipteronia dyeriana]|uniref:CMP/dCMP-type deaminase domain-containing protein n=1 Tax=Dipteronia dyeriana TaxID=168575 RepID=A0AAD9XG97_9ROSI|nr:hypothetical protein Ddye_005338 [Dipteronia dyeriana]